MTVHLSRSHTEQRLVSFSSTMAYSQGPSLHVYTYLCWDKDIGVLTLGLTPAHSLPPPPPPPGAAEAHHARDDAQCAAARGGGHGERAE
jgi:hypothetical protein